MPRRRHHDAPERPPRPTGDDTARCGLGRSRRGFLRAAGSVLAAGGLGLGRPLEGLAGQRAGRPAEAAAVRAPRGAAEGSSGRAGSTRPQLGAASILFRELRIEDVCQRVSALGFGAIDIWSAHDGCPHLDDAQRRLGPGGLKELLTRHGLTLGSFSVYRGGYRPYAEFLGKLGGGVAVRGSTRLDPSADITASMSAFLDDLEPLVELAEANDSCLAIENRAGALLDSLESIEAFVDLARSPRLGIALAPYHLQARKESVEDAIRLCGDRLLYFYAWQQGPDHKQLPGYGPVDFTPWLRTLDEVGYRRPIYPYVQTPAEPAQMATALAHSRDYLQACLERIAEEKESSERLRDTEPPPPEGPGR